MNVSARRSDPPCHSLPHPVSPSVFVTLTPTADDRCCTRAALRTHIRTRDLRSTRFSTTSIHYNTTMPLNAEMDDRSRVSRRRHARHTNVWPNGHHSRASQHKMKIIHAVLGHRTGCFPNSLVRKACGSRILFNAEIRLNPVSRDPKMFVGRSGAPACRNETRANIDKAIWENHDARLNLQSHKHSTPRTPHPAPLMHQTSHDSTKTKKRTHAIVTSLVILI